MIEYFLDDAQQNRFRVKGGNNEIVATSEPYATRSNAARGVRDLYDILRKDLGYEASPDGPYDGATEEHRPDGPDGSRGGSSTLAQPEDAPSIPQGEEETSIQESPERGSRHDEVPGDNPAALKPNGDDDAA